MADVRRLPAPVTDIWDWQLQGSCRDVGSDLFFHPERERGPARAVREGRAKTVCRGCPVVTRCRDHALAVHEPYGVWGGLTEEERKQQLRADAARPATADGAQPVVIGVDFIPASRHRRQGGPTSDPWPAA